MTAMLTQHRLKELFYYDANSGIFTRRVSTNHSAIAGTVAGTDDGAGYLRITIDKKRYRVHRLAWLFVYGVFPTLELDHINQNKSDNRIVNLRVVNKSENQQNTKAPATNTSGVKGVYWNKAAKKWQAQFCFKGKLMYLGIFSCLQAATLAYQKAISSFHTHAPVPKKPK